MIKNLHCGALLFFLFFINSPVAAEKLLLSDYQGVSLPYKQLLLVEDGASPPYELNSLQAWANNYKNVKEVSLFGGRYWAIYQIHNDTDSTDWVLDAANSLIEEVEYRIYHADRLSIYKSGFYEPDEYFLRYGRSIEINKGETVVIAVKLDSSYFASQPRIELETEKNYSAQNYVELALIFAALGTLLSFTIYNFFIYIGSKDSSPFYYALYLLTYFIAWALVLQVPNELLGFSCLEVSYIPFFLLPLVSAYFCINFLQLASYLPSVQRVLLWNGYISAGLSVVTIFFIQYAHALATITIGIWILLAIYAGVYRWKQGFKAARYFVFAFLCLLIPAIFILPANIGLVPDFLPNSELATLMGGTLDGILLAFAMADRVKLINEKNRKLTAELESKVKNRTKALQEANTALEHLIDELREANETKNRFLANMSHEIRTPLTSVIGFSQALSRGEVEQEEQFQALQAITDNGEHLLQVINDILDLNKIEANKLTFEIVDTPLLNLLSQVHRAFQNKAAKKGLDYQFSYQYPLPECIETDPTRLRQILFNVIGNAIKFTEAGYVKVNVNVESHYLNVQVVDTGVGLDKEQQSRLFNPFQQADNSINRKFGGTGLGLSISRCIANGLGGDISISSELGKGSEFTLRLELRTPENVNWLSSSEEVRQNAPVESQPEELLPVFSGVSVLLVEDHFSNRELITGLLNNMGIVVTAVENGQQALKTVYKDEFDLILMDIQMPVMDGITAFRKLRAARVQSPIIALTANNMAHEIEEYLKVGFNDYLSKPISRYEFVEKLKLFLPEQEGKKVLPPQKFEVLAEDYAEELTAYVTAAKIAWGKKDYEQLLEISHKVYGSAAAFGFSDIGESFANIGRALKTKDWQLLEDNVNVMQNLYDVSERQSIQSEE